MDLQNNNNEKFVIKGDDLNYEPHPKGMGWFFYYNMKKHKHAIAQRDATTGVKDTYGSLLKRCIRTAIEMRNRGITSQDIISTCIANSLNSCVPFISTLFLGARISVLDPMIPVKDTSYLIQQVRPKMIFVGPESLEMIEEAVVEADHDTEIVVLGPSEVYAQFSDFFAPKPNEDFFPVEINNNRETALILFSSGTTGFPKGICISHYGLMAQSYQVVAIGYKLDCVLSYATFYWISTCALFGACTISGGCRLISPRYNPNQVWKMLDQFKVTLLFAAPSQAIAMYKTGRPDGIDTSQLDTISIGGGPMSSEHILAVRDIYPGTFVNLLYGQTELSGVGLGWATNNRKSVMLMNEKPGSCGKPVKGMVCKIVDPDTEETLGPNEKGELRVKADFLMNGYYHLDSSDVYDQDGWLKSGDIAYYDVDDYFYIADRLKEMLKYQSYHVCPAVIEGILLSHPCVSGAVVIGVPNDEDGDHPAAVIVLKDPKDEVTSDELIKYVEERVHDRERLRGGVKFVEKLPITATGKIKRSDAKKLFLEG